MQNTVLYPNSHNWFQSCQSSKLKSNLLLLDVFLVKFDWLYRRAFVIAPKFWILLDKHINLTRNSIAYVMVLCNNLVLTTHGQYVFRISKAGYWYVGMEWMRTVSFCMPTQSMIVYWWWIYQCSYCWRLRIDDEYIGDDGIYQWRVYCVELCNVICMSSNFAIEGWLWYLFQKHPLTLTITINSFLFIP